MITYRKDWLILFLLFLRFVDNIKEISRCKFSFPQSPSPPSYIPLVKFVIDKQEEKNVRKMFTLTSWKKIRRKHKRKTNIALKRQEKFNFVNSIKTCFVDACKVDINMFLRSISKIDDYKMVSVSATSSKNSSNKSRYN